jgi:hypothetical protein
MPLYLFATCIVMAGALGVLAVFILWGVVEFLIEFYKAFFA